MLHMSDATAHPFLGLHGEHSSRPHGFGAGGLQRFSDRLWSGMQRVLARSFALPSCTPPRRPGTAHPQFKACYYR